MKKKKTTSFLGVVVTILLLLVAASTIFTTVLFAGSDTPEIFGHYIYLQKSHAMEVADGSDDSASIHAETAVIVQEYNGTDPLSINNAILCVLSPDDSSPIEDKDANGYAIRRILKIEAMDETGELLYYPTTMQADRVGTEPPITSSSILGICQFEHGGLYAYITFVQSLTGILLLLALPCVLLIALLIAKVIRSRNRRLDEEAVYEEEYDEDEDDTDYDDEYDDDRYDDDDYDEDYDDGRYTTGRGDYAPLFPQDGAALNNTTEFNRKRSSIADNFERKNVNPNSPYQKARTMQFKAQKDVPILRHPYEQQQMLQQMQQQTNSYVGKYAADSSSSLQDSFDRIESSMSPAMSEMASSVHTPKAPEYHGSHEATGTFKKNLTIGSTSTFKRPNVDDILNANDSIARTMARNNSQNTSTLSKEDLAKVTASPTRRTTPSTTTTVSRSVGKYAAPRKVNSSVNDLLDMIEDQKNKF